MHNKRKEKTTNNLLEFVIFPWTLETHTHATFPEIMTVNESQHKQPKNCVTDRTIVIDDAVFMLLRKKQRSVYHQTCLISVMAAFTIGLAIGIFFLPLIGLTSAKSSSDTISIVADDVTPMSNELASSVVANKQRSVRSHSKHHKYDFRSANSKNQIHDPKDSRNGKNFTPTKINNNNFLNPTFYSSVSFISDQKYSIENILNSLNNGNARKVNSDYSIRTEHDDDDVADGDVFTEILDDVENISNKSYNSQSNRNMNNDFDGSEDDNTLAGSNNVFGVGGDSLQKNYIPIGKESLSQSDDDLNGQYLYEKENNETLRRIVENGIYWGQMVEDQLPVGFKKRDTEDWQNYLENNSTEIVRIEQGCGRMQNRLVTFSDGVKACVRYRQNTDQIQGELFSFFLGRLLNITNLAPSTAAVINWDLKPWTQVKQHITESQWKTSRPVVLTKWIPDLEPSGIPPIFQQIERHLNRDDIRNITMIEEGDTKTTQILIDRLKPTYNASSNQMNAKKLWQKKKITLSDQMLTKFIELAQWSDLIIFDYLIANLDRVVNNLYNFQWNADIMAAPAHNLAKQIKSQQLVFLDNESGLLHGYRLLKKYESYHGLLLDNLCIFRKTTVVALKFLQENNAGELLNEYFEKTTTSKVRDVLPPLPEKSIKILNNRVDRVLQQVKKCQDIYSNR